MEAFDPTSRTKVQSFNPHQVSEIGLVYKTEVKPSDRPKITSSNDAYDIFKAKWNHDEIELREEFKILLLNRGNRVLGIVNISTGGVSGTVVDPKIIFSSALKANACGIIMAHNHPSGNLKPSQTDINLTKKIRQGAQLLDMSLLDHIILSSDGYYSFSDECMIS